MVATYSFGSVYKYSILGKIAVTLSKLVLFMSKLFHAYVECVHIVKTKYQISPYKIVV